MFELLKKGLTFILIAGVGLALLRAFGGDPIAVVEWAGEWVWHFIERVADFFSSNDSFRDATKKPS